MKKSAKVVAMGLVLAVCAYSMVRTPWVWSMGSRVPTVGMQAEDFRLTDLAGKEQSLSQYRGKIVLLNFWATWCKP
ncbi:MAG: thiol-disulfide oxidoreductase, partial [Nitrospiraceae bacterium]